MIFNLNLVYPYNKNVKNIWMQIKIIIKKL